MASEARVRNPWKSELLQLSFLYFFLLFFSQFTCEDHSLPVYHAQVQIELILHKEPKKICLAPKSQGFVTRWVLALQWYPGGVDANPVD